MHRQSKFPLKSTLALRETVAAVIPRNVYIIQRKGHGMEETSSHSDRKQRVSACYLQYQQQQRSKQVLSCIKCAHLRECVHLRKSDAIIFISRRCRNLSHNNSEYCLRPYHPPTTIPLPLPLSLQEPHQQSCTSQKAAAHHQSTGNSPIHPKNTNVAHLKRPATFLSSGGKPDWALAA
jgi:hypothetical protein